MPRYALIKPRSNKEWNVYHEIKETEIFIPLNLTYNRQHSSFYEEPHHHFIFLRKATIIGIFHFQLITIHSCAIRTIAIKNQLQNQGLGSTLLTLAENIIKKYQINIIYVHANPNSKSFYERMGYVETLFPNDVSINSETIDLAKTL